MTDTFSSGLTFGGDGGWEERFPATGMELIFVFCPDPSQPVDPRPGDPGKTPRGQISPLPQTEPRLLAPSIPVLTTFPSLIPLAPGTFLLSLHTHQLHCCLWVPAVLALFLECALPRYLITDSLMSLKPVLGEAILDHPICNPKLLPNPRLGFPLPRSFSTACITLYLTVCIAVLFFHVLFFPSST